MIYFKRVSVFIALCCLLGAIVSLFLPPEVTFQESIVIAADKPTVQKQLRAFKYQSIAQFSLADEDWKLNELHAGLEVISQVKLSIGFNPIHKFIALLNKEELTQTFQSKFDSIVAVLEELPKIQRVVVQKEMMKKDIWFLAIRDTINQLNMNNIQGKYYDEINQFLKKLGYNNTQQPPLAIYHTWSDTLIDIEVGVEVSDSAIKSNSRIRMHKIKKSNVVTALHRGDYNRLPETYFGINEWLRKNKAVVVGPPWEVYLTDPSSEKEVSQWETAIYFPIK